MDQSEKDALLEEAKRRYPVGTEFKAARRSRSKYIVKSLEDFYWRDADNICTKRNGNGTVYSKESGTWKWAEIVSKPVAKEPEFIVGKWYKSIGSNGWKRFLKLIGSNWYYTEEIYAYGSSFKHFFKNDHVVLPFTFEPLTDLSEIQQYLPSGHPDLLPKTDTMKELTELPEKWIIQWKNKDIFDAVNKDLKNRLQNTFKYVPNAWSSIDNYWSSTPTNPRKDHTEITFDQFKRWVLKESDTLEVDDLVEGEIYFHGSGNYGWLFIFSNLNGGSIEGKQCISSKKSSSFYETYCNPYGKDEELRKATDEEKQWLEACIKAGKFVSFEDSKKVSDVPEYVECIKQVGYCKIGIVYQSRYNNNRFEWYYGENDTFNGDPSELNIWDSMSVDYLWTKNFKPSTKEAYDAQQRSQSTPQPEPVKIKQSIKDILKEAKRKYPIGTRFKSLISGEEKTVKNGAFIVRYEENAISDTSETSGSYLYRDGKWAEIIESAQVLIPREFFEAMNTYDLIHLSDVDLLDYCRKKFPIGCSVVSHALRDTVQITDHKQFYESDLFMRSKGYRQVWFEAGYRVALVYDERIGPEKRLARIVGKSADGPTIFAGGIDPCIAPSLSKEVPLEDLFKPSRTI
jgi:hypothetical protein